MGCDTFIDRYCTLHIASIPRYFFQCRNVGFFGIRYRNYSLFYGLLPFSMEIDQSFIAAILTVIGYSVNDKVVVFDRVREVIGLYPKRDRYLVINEALNSTLARTISTSLSTAIVLLCIFILGGDTIRSFTFAMLLGVIVGTFSTLFVAVPVAYEIMGRKQKKAQLAEAAK